MTEPRQTYDAFAPFYDRFTAGYDHAAWTARLEELAAGAGLRGRRLLDVACGTGMSFLPMLDRGYDVTACDISPEMVARAAAKAGTRARVEVCDMRRLPSYGSFDLVWCLDDSLNYLLGTNDLVAALSGMRENLDDSGVLIFDVNSIRSYRSFFASLWVVPSDDCVLTWDGETADDFAEGGIALASVQALSRGADGTWERTEIAHRQRHHPEAGIRSALERAGLRCEGLWGMQLDGSMSSGFDELGNSKAVYVCTRGGEAPGRTPSSTPSASRATRVTSGRSERHDVTPGCSTGDGCDAEPPARRHGPQRSGPAPFDAAVPPPDPGPTARGSARSEPG